MPGKNTNEYANTSRESRDTRGERDGGKEGGGRREGDRQTGKQTDRQTENVTKSTYLLDVHSHSIYFPHNPSICHAKSSVDECSLT